MKQIILVKFPSPGCHRAHLCGRQWVCMVQLANMLLPAGSQPFLRLKHASRLTVFLVSRVIFCVYKITSFYQMKSLNCQAIRKASWQLSARHLFLPSSSSSLQENEHQWKDDTSDHSNMPQTGGCSHCWDTKSEDPDGFPVHRGKIKVLSPTAGSRDPELQTSRSLTITVKLLYSHSDFQRCFTPQIPENPS